MNAVIAVLGMALTALVGWAVARPGAVTYEMMLAFWVLSMALIGIFAAKARKREAHFDFMRERIGDRAHWDKVANKG